MTKADLPRQKVDRDEVFIEYTKSICPVCKVVVDAAGKCPRQQSVPAQALPGARKL